MAFSGLYRWQRLGAAARPKPKFNSDSVEYWIKRVEQASEFAVSEAFSLNKSAYRKGLHGPVLDLETTEQLQDHDEAYAEATAQTMRDHEPECDKCLQAKRN